MAPGRKAGAGVRTMSEITGGLQSSTVTARGHSLDALLLYFKSDEASHNLLDHKQHHAICEALFTCVRLEKKTFFSEKTKNKNTPLLRLKRCAEALRLLVGHEPTKTKAKPIEAIVDHITQFLPGPNGDYFEPLLQDYFKAFAALLKRPAVLEVITQNEAAVWEKCAVFCVEALQRYVGSDAGSGRNSPTLGTASFSGSRSGSVLGQRNDGQVGTAMATDIASALDSLVSVPTSPILGHAEKISGVLLHVLQIRQNLTSLQKWALSAVNQVFVRVQLNNLSLAKKLTRSLVPLITYWWQNRASFRDAMISSMREELMKTVFAMHLHLDSLVRQASDDSLLQDVDELLCMLWSEYSKRDERSRLQLDDITLEPARFASDGPATAAFRLQLFNTSAEINWALLDNIAILETIYSRGKTADCGQSTKPEGNHARKRQKVAESGSRTFRKLSSLDPGTTLTALQLLPFVFERKPPTLDDITEGIGILRSHVTSKNAIVASWAMLSCSSLTGHQLSRTPSLLPTWKQLWQVSARCVSLPGISRAACALLHSILRVNLLPRHEIADDVNQLVVSAGVSGPSMLVDSSLSLMLELLRFRHAVVPNASQATSSHIIQWMFLKWSPAETAFASTHSRHVTPCAMNNLLRACCSLSLPDLKAPRRAFGGSIAQFWKQQQSYLPMARYLLLLEDDPGLSAFTSQDDRGDVSGPMPDSSSSDAAKRLILELFLPKIEELVQVSQSWQKKAGDGTLTVSLERVQSLISACILGALLLPELGKLNTQSSQKVDTGLFALFDNVLKTVVKTAGDNEAYLELFLMSSAPYIPGVSGAELGSLKQNQAPLLRLFSELSLAMEEQRIGRERRAESDSMDVDRDFDAQASVRSSSWRTPSLTRPDVWLSETSQAFYVETRLQLYLLQLVNEAEGPIRDVPAAIVDRLAELSEEELTCCRVFMRDLFSSDLITAPDDADRIIQIVVELNSHEASFCTIFDVLESLISVWSDDSLEVAGVVRSFYIFVHKTALEKNLLSPVAQIWFCRLLFRLLEVNADYGKDVMEDGEDADLRSCRTTILNMSKDCVLEVQSFIGVNLYRIFGLYVFKEHEKIFGDILNNGLPHDLAVPEGIAYRLFVLAELACKWPTLLRQCIYNTFHTTGKCADSAKHATACLGRVSECLGLESPKEIFRLSMSQILYTWLVEESIKDIPYAIFGFSNLKDLLAEAQTEAAAIMVMRGQEQAVLSLAELLDLNVVAMVQLSFVKMFSYTLCYHMSEANTSGRELMESPVQRLLGDQLYRETLHVNFADIVATFFAVLDQESRIDKYLRKDPRFAEAAKKLDEMKSLGHLDTQLPPNQQPQFLARYLQLELQVLCESTGFDLETLWTPALVVSVARKLLGTVHPFLGPQYACSVVRKLRLLISLAGDQAVSGYPLEMLLHSIRVFMGNSECADDALGITRYLLEKGQGYLGSNPSFLAGYALSTLADLRVFLDSSQSNTTLESQFSATMAKARLFHSWFFQYLTAYQTRSWTDDAHEAAFKSISQSAAHIRPSGNAEKGTHESKLLLDVLEDWDREKPLLNEPSREVAMAMLCGTFEMPTSNQQDVIETDETALLHSAVVWKSCRSQKLSQSYLSWAGRVVGRSFAASGEISQELFRESRLEEYRSILPDDMGSEEGLLKLMGTLTVSPDSHTAGLAESALRIVFSHAVAEDDTVLRLACQNSLSESLLASCNWGPYRTPPSEYLDVASLPQNDAFSAKHLESPSWASEVAVHLTMSEPEIVTLSVLPPLLSKVKGFAERAFPFVVHLVLSCQLDKHQTAKRHLSGALKAWLKSDSTAAVDNLKLLINTLLYLRTQPMPREVSIADRTHWLDVDFPLAAAAATRCGMYKVALLFAELTSPDTTRTGRRSSASRDADESSEVLLHIFENIDDPDAFYGLKQDASLSTVVSRLEYENDGPKSLAFRGAQYDSHLRRGDGCSKQDAQALVKILCGLGLLGLSDSVLQALESSDVATDSQDSAFMAARKLERWNLPVPVRHDSHEVTMYKAYQSMHKAVDLAPVRRAIYDCLGSTMVRITKGNLSGSRLRQHLGALAALTELEDILKVPDVQELQAVFASFENRATWMKSGRYSDVSQILSCRETTLSMISQHEHLGRPTVAPSHVRLVQIKGMLLSAAIYRVHRATQESLNLSTALSHLVEPSEAEGLIVDASISIEASNSLWDQGQMMESIDMLKKVDRNSVLKKQSVSISRATLMSMLGHRVSEARLEPPDSIQKSYLEPALKDLKGKSEGREAGQVFHQFAMFCDQQLQNPDGLEDLGRLQSLKQGKSTEVAELKAMLAGARGEDQVRRYTVHYNRAKSWLDLDSQELRRVEQTRNEFVRLSLENYLLSLVASDEHDSDAVRFTALWFERAEDETANNSVKKHLFKVPTHKFAGLMNQLSSRLQDSDQSFSKLLKLLVLSICVDHPYHGMYQIWSGSGATKHNKQDEVARSRCLAANAVIDKIQKTEKVSRIWTAISRTNKLYHNLALDRDDKRFKSGLKMPIKQSVCGAEFLQGMVNNPIPPPTMQIPLSADKDYSKVPVVVKFDQNMTIASGVSAPKIITAFATDGKQYKQLVKGGQDDLRQDAIMEQVFAAVSELLKLHRTTRQRNLGIRTYKVLPLTAYSGLIEFVQDTIPLHDYLMPAHERYYPKDWKGSMCRREMAMAQESKAEARVAAYRKATDHFHPVMRYFFHELFPDPDDWFARRTAYTRSTAAVSMLGHVLGLGDRHGHNILLDKQTGEVVHIDLGVAFESGRVLPVPELVPFRLTRDIVDGMGSTRTEGVFRRCCEFVLDALREETYSIVTILDVLRYDPLYTWSISPVRMSKLQQARSNDGVPAAVYEDGGAAKKPKNVNEPSEADRALEVVKKKLSKTLSVTATVNHLINQATDERNLAMLYSGWAAYA